MASITGLPITSLAQISPADDGEALGLTFNLEGGEQETIIIPFAVIRDFQIALSHARRALQVKRQPRDEDSAANLLPVDGIKASNLTSSDVRLEFAVAGQATFPFLLTREWARQLVEVLQPWCNSTGPDKSGSSAH